MAEGSIGLKKVTDNSDEWVGRQADRLTNEQTDGWMQIIGFRDGEEHSEAALLITTLHFWVGLLTV